MKIIKPSYTIEAPENYFDWSLKHIEKAIRVCYKSEGKITDSSAEPLINRIIDSKHMSTIEHAGVSVRFIIDRGISHELVRHRLASFSQESTIYCCYAQERFENQITYIQPCWLKEDLVDIWNYGVTEKSIHNTEMDSFISSEVDVKRQEIWGWMDALLKAEKSYFTFLKDWNWTPKKARTFLPNATKTEIMVTANYREWRHILKLRTAPQAHPQIREVMVPLLKELSEKVPIIFDDLLPLAHPI